MKKLQATLNKILEQSTCFDDADKKDILLKASVHVQNNDESGLRKYIKHVTRIAAEQSMFEQLMQNEDSAGDEKEINWLFSLNNTETEVKQSDNNHDNTVSAIENIAKIVENTQTCEYERDIYAELEEQEDEELYLENTDDDGFEEYTENDTDNAVESDDYILEEIESLDDSEDYNNVEETTELDLSAYFDDSDEYDDVEEATDSPEDEYLLDSMDDSLYEDENSETIDEDSLLDSIDMDDDTEEPLLDNIDVDYEDEDSLLDSIADETEEEPMSEDEILLASLEDDTENEDDAEYEDDDSLLNSMNEFDEEEYEASSDNDALLDSFDLDDDSDEPLLDNIDVDYEDEDSLLDSMSDEEPEEYTSIDLDQFEDDGFEDEETDEDALLDSIDEDDTSEDSLLSQLEENEEFEDEAYFDDDSLEIEPANSFKNNKSSGVSQVKTSQPIAFGGTKAGQLPNLGITPSQKQPSSTNANLGQNKNQKNPNASNAIFKDRRANGVLKLFGLK